MAVAGTTFLKDLLWWAKELSDEIATLSLLGGEESEGPLFVAENPIHETYRLLMW